MSDLVIIQTSVKLAPGKSNSKRPISCLSGMQRTVYAVLRLNDRSVLIAGVKITVAKNGKISVSRIDRH